MLDRPNKHSRKYITILKFFYDNVFSVALILTLFSASGRCCERKEPNWRTVHCLVILRGMFTVTVSRFTTVERESAKFPPVLVYGCFMIVTYTTANAVKLL